MAKLHIISRINSVRFTTLVPITSYKALLTSFTVANTLIVEQEQHLQYVSFLILVITPTARQHSNTYYIVYCLTV